MCRTCLGSLAVFTAEKRSTSKGSGCSTLLQAIIWALDPHPPHNNLEPLLVLDILSSVHGVGTDKYSTSRLSLIFLSISHLFFPLLAFSSSSTPLFFYHCIHSLCYFSPLGKTVDKTQGPNIYEIRVLQKKHFPEQ